MSQTKQHPENGGTKNSLAWEVFKEQRESDLPNKSQNFKYEVTGIRREDGFTLIREVLTKGKTERFLCRGDFGEFKFSAHRWDSRNEKPTDCYIVPLFLCAPEDKILCRLHSKDVESALLNFPTSRIFDYIATQNVLFDISAGNANTAPHLLHASEVGHD